MNTPAGSRNSKWRCSRTSPQHLCQLGRIAVLSATDAPQYASSVCCRGTVQLLIQTSMNSSQYTKKSMERILVATTQAKWLRALSCSMNFSVENYRKQRLHHRVLRGSTKIVPMAIFRLDSELDFKLPDSIERTKKFAITVDV